MAAQQHDHNQFALGETPDTISPSPSPSPSTSTPASTIIRTPTASLPTWVWGWFACLSAACLYFFSFFIKVIPSVMSHQIMYAYHLNTGSVGHLMSAFYYVYIPMQLIVGVLIDYYGSRQTLTFAALITSLGVYCFASAHTIWMAGLAQFTVGLGASFVFIGTLKLITVWLPLRWFALLAGMIVAIGMMGAMVGDVVLSLMLTAFGWKLSCYLVSGFGLIVCLLVWFTIRDDQTLLETYGRHDLRGEDQLTEKAYPPRLELKSLSYALLHLMPNKQLWLIGIVGCLLYLPICGFTQAWQIPFLRDCFHFSQYAAAKATSMVFLGWALGAPLIGWFSDIMQQRRLPITLGAACSLIVFAYLIYVPTLNEVQMDVLFLFLGIFGSSQVLTLVIACEKMPVALLGTTVTFINTIVSLAGFSPELIGRFLHALQPNLEKMQIGLSPFMTPIAHYQLAFCVFLVGLFLAIYLTFYIDETYCRRPRLGNLNT